LILIESNYLICAGEFLLLYRVFRL